jgi:hypothetical protein
VGAIGSNNERYGCEDVVLMFPEHDVIGEIEEFMSSLSRHLINPWKQRQ